MLRIYICERGENLGHSDLDRFTWTKSWTEFLDISRETVRVQEKEGFIRTPPNRYGPSSSLSKFETCGIATNSVLEQQGTASDSCQPLGSQSTLAKHTQLRSGITADWGTHLPATKPVARNRKPKSLGDKAFKPRTRESQTKGWQACIIMVHKSSYVNNSQGNNSCNCNCHLATKIIL